MALSHIPGLTKPMIFHETLRPEIVKLDMPLILRKSQEWTSSSFCNIGFQSCITSREPCVYHLFNELHKLW